MRASNSFVGVGELGKPKMVGEAVRYVPQSGIEEKNRKQKTPTIQ